MTEEMLEKINRFTRRKFSEDELYVFSVILCDNDIDRDGERFSDSALDQLCRLFIGKTGISDHDPSSSNQTARIFDAEVVTDENHITRFGGTYRYLKAMAYMVRTDDNRDLITQIDGGIRKEVSISCTAGKRTCSICGEENCAHTKGREYGGKPCCHVLDSITDAYEWSFVAVPAQVNAGVTKRFSASEVSDSGEVCSETAAEELRCEIRRLAYFAGGRSAAEAAALSARDMTEPQLVKLKKDYEKLCGRSGIQVQLDPEDDGDSSGSFRTGGKKEEGNEYRIG